MGYRVKWVEENLGISRKALRIYEREGLMPENKNSLPRDYSEEDIERIWFIRVMQGMGYTVKEIAALVNGSDTEELDFQESIARKVMDLERKKEEIEKHLGYAKTIKLTGRFPSRPEEIGTMKFDEFYEKAIEGWNINNDPQTETFQEITELILNKSPEEWNDTDVGRLFGLLDSCNFADMNVEAIMSDAILPKAILKRKDLGYNNPEVQVLVKLIYENQVEIIPELAEMTPQQFARYQSSAYLYGDLAKLKEKEYGKDGCKFLADAIATFGGYIDADDPQLV